MVNPNTMPSKFDDTNVVVDWAGTPPEDIKLAFTFIPVELINGVRAR